MTDTQQAPAPVEELRAWGLGAIERLREAEVRLHDERVARAKENHARVAFLAELSSVNAEMGADNRRLVAQLEEARRRISVLEEAIRMAGAALPAPIVNVAAPNVVVEVPPPAATRTEIVVTRGAQGSIVGASATSVPQ